MGICDSKSKGEKYENRILQMSIDHPVIPLYAINQVSKSICKITIKKQTQDYFGTGFFMNLDSSQYLITNYHIISKDVLNEDIEIEISNHRKMKLNFKNRQIRFFPKYRDITIIEMKYTDSIYEDIEFLEYDKLFYRKEGYSIYLNTYAFTVGYPFGEVSCASGKITKIKYYEFEHNIPTKMGLSGCPIISLEYMKVIGIHKEGDYLKNINLGTFIGEIFNNDEDLFSNNLSNNSRIENYIIAEIFISDKDINNNIRIINSHDEFYRKMGLNVEEKNEKQIVNCEIRINNVLVPFNYFYTFPKIELYKIKYSFINYLTNTSYMFALCSSLTNINLSNFNTQLVNDMSCMFLRCRALNNIELSNFKTKNVTNMSYMFSECFSLNSINVSNFNTQNVINMCHMFSWCISLTYLDLSNFETKLITNFSFMFVGCKSLKRENIITRDNRLFQSLRKSK